MIRILFIEIMIWYEKANFDKVIRRNYFNYAIINMFQKSK